MLYLCLAVTTNSISSVPELGKCRHGGTTDDLTTTNISLVPGGINKQSESPEFSPHYHLHRDAAWLATQHVTEYLFGEREGMLLTIESYVP